MNSTTAQSKPIGIKEINERLLKWKLPVVDSAKAQAISRVCRDEFLSNLAKVENTQGQDKVSVTWIMVAISSMSEFVSKELFVNGLGHITTDDCLKTATQNPNAYLSAVKEAQSGRNSNLLNLMNGDSSSFEGKELPVQAALVLGKPQEKGEKMSNSEDDVSVAGFISGIDQVESKKAPEAPDFSKQSHAQAAANTQAKPGPSPVSQSNTKPAVVHSINQSREAEDQGKGDFKSLHFYGSKFAICISAEKSTRGMNTVNFEAANSKGERSYDWATKINVQLSQKELYAALAVFSMYTSKIDFSGHGPLKDKGFSIENQGDKFYVVVKQANNGLRGVPVPFMDAIAAVPLIMGQILKNEPHLTSFDIWKLMDCYFPKAQQQSGTSYSPPPKKLDEPKKEELPIASSSTAGAFL